MSNRRVVVTGIGAITPIGNNLKDYWSSLKKERVERDQLHFSTLQTLKQNLHARLKILTRMILLIGNRLEN